MFRTDAVCRTVNLVRPLQVETRTGANGAYEYKSILFRIATDRNYKTTQIVNGQQVTDYPTDFVLCRATGNIAQIINDNCMTNRKEDGKIVSRHLYLHGHFETYQTEREVPIETMVKINGLDYKINLKTTIKVDGFIFVVTDVEFLDSKAHSVSQLPGGTVTSCTVVAPEGVQASMPVTAPAVPQSNGQIGGIPVQGSSATLPFSNMSSVPQAQPMNMGNAMAPFPNAGQVVPDNFMNVPTTATPVVAAMPPVSGTTSNVAVPTTVQG